MRTNEERIAAMHARAAELNKQQRSRRIRIVQLVSTAVCFAAVILLAVCMRGIMPSQLTPADGSPGDMHASLFAASGALGYVVIAIIAFILGVAVTAFCFLLKKQQDGKDDIQVKEE